MKICASDRRFDVAVIGAGVVGCAVARRFSLEGAKVAVLEKARDVLDGASKANSAILHTGFDAPPGSLEARCVAEGYREYLDIHQRLGLPLIRSGALVIAWSEEEEARLPALIAQARENGVEDLEPLTAERTRALEPALAPSLRASFRVPGEFLIDPWSAPHAYLLQALVNGAALFRDAAVTGGAFDGALWRLETRQGPVEAGLVVNAAGLYGDRLDAALLGAADFEIRPRKGQFVLFDAPAARLAGHILLPTPTEKTKGVVVCRTAWGKLLVGPTAEDQEDREVAALDRGALEALIRRGCEILPALAREEVVASYAGLRPATESKAYRVRAHPGRNYLTLGGVRSTGLSAALGLARHAFELSKSFGPPPRALADPLWPAMPNISEAGPRDWERPGHGGIVCHCEQVTRREIEAALTGPLAPGGFGGLKRLTRATMGRCQGFYCSAALAEITQGRLAEPMIGEIDG